jgi:hypothetical protein
MFLQFAITIAAMIGFYAAPIALYHVTVGRKDEWQDSTLAFACFTFLPWTLFGLWLIQA